MLVDSPEPLLAERCSADAVECCGAHCDLRNYTRMVLSETAHCSNESSDYPSRHTREPVRRIGLVLLFLLIIIGISFFLSASLLSAPH